MSKGTVDFVVGEKFSNLTRMPVHEPVQLATCSFCRFSVNDLSSSEIYMFRLDFLPNVSLSITKVNYNRKLMTTFYAVLNK